MVGRNDIVFSGYKSQRTIEIKGEAKKQRRHRRREKTRERERPRENSVNRRW